LTVARAHATLRALKSGSTTITYVRRATLTLALSLLVACTQRHPHAPYTEQLPHARELAQRFLIVDTHIDVPYSLQEGYYDLTVQADGHDFDFPRARAGGLDIPFMSIYVPADYENNGARAFADKLIDMVEDIARKAPEKFGIAYSVADARRLAGEGRIALALGMENGAPIEGDLANLAHFQQRGIRYITLAHSKNNHIADSSYDTERKWHGLSPFGELLVADMNKRGVMVDVSHVSDEAFARAVEISQVPVIASHSSARHFTPGFERNPSDELIRSLAARGGVIQVNFGSTFLTATANAWSKAYNDQRDKYLEEHGYEKNGPEDKAFEADYRAKTPLPYASLDDLLDHIDYIRDLVGVDHIGLGSDFDGVGDSLPVGVKSVADYPNIVAGLLARGYGEEDIEKILGGNLLRVWSAVEAYAAPREQTPP
jgi:membrane dipeptidase